MALSKKERFITDLMIDNNMSIDENIPIETVMDAFELQIDIGPAI